MVGTVMLEKTGQWQLKCGHSGILWNSPFLGNALVRLSTLTLRSFISIERPGPCDADLLNKITLNVVLLLWHCLETSARAIN